MSRSARVATYLLGALLSTVTILRAGTVIYVDDSATGANDGFSWCDAFVYLQDALAAAEASGGAVTEIHVAQGTYKPDQGANATPGDRTASFNLVDGVALRGGYAGCGAADPNERDIRQYESILSGDLIGDDAPNTSSCCKATGFPGCDQDQCESTVCTAQPQCCAVWSATCTSFAANVCPDICGRISDNSLHIVTLEPTVIDSTLAGFVIAYGNAEFEDGGGLQNSGQIHVYDCVFRQNTANRGGAVLHASGFASFEDCLFVENQVSDRGGAIYSLANISLRRCRFASNRSISFGASYYEQSNDSLIDTCVFCGNSCLSLGCWATSHAGSRNVITDSVVCGNTGGVRARSNQEFRNIAIIGNTAFGMSIEGSVGTKIMVESTVAHNGDATFSEGGIGVSGSTVVLHGVIAFGNLGAALTVEQQQLKLNGGTLSIDSSLVEGWTGTFGGVANIGDDPLFVGGPSGMWTSNATYDSNVGETTLTDESLSWQPDELANKFLNPDTTQYLQSFIVGNTATTITVLGDFASLGVPGATYKINDYRLSSGSPSIDSADNTAVPTDEFDLDNDGDTTEPSPYDLDGNPRFKDDPLTPDTGVGTPPIVDMGAYEYQRGCLADSDCDNLDPCDGVETCVDNVCEPGTPIACDDGVSCTEDICNSMGICEHFPNDGSCDDGVFCNGNEVCDPVADCQAGMPPVCDDELQCTVDTCDGGLNDCRFTPLNSRCNDLNDCTNDICVPGVGCENINICDDGDPLTCDICTTGTCTYIIEGAPCSDGNACTLNDTCTMGECTPGSSIVCDDEDPCTGIETCNPQTGCVTSLNADCNENEIEDVCDIGSTSFDTNANSIPDECEPGACCLSDHSCVDQFQPECAQEWVPGLTCAPSPCALLPEVETLGCRYMGVSAAVGADPNSSIALRVTRSDEACPVKYVAPDAGIGRLVDVPVFQTVNAWGIIEVADAESFPSGTYEVRTQTATDLSDPVAVTLRKWGDVVSPFGGTAQPNFADITAIVDCFKDAPNAPPLSACDIHPAAPDQTANFADITAGVDAFKGLAFPGGPCS